MEGDNMNTVMTAEEFTGMAKRIAAEYRTLYVMGCFGAPMTPENKQRYCRDYKYNRQPKRMDMIMHASPDTFGFDCVNLIKGILWGWNGDLSKAYGGAAYQSNGVPDVGADAMIRCCHKVSAGDWGKMLPGEVVWMKGHIGIYIGDGLVVECSPKWQNKVQITAVDNNGEKNGYYGRTWTKHGRLPWISYGKKQTAFQMFRILV